MTDIAELWDFDDAASSEARFRAAADLESGPERAVLLTQVARALGLQGEFDQGRAVITQIMEGPLSDLTAEVIVRATLERGRLLRSGGDPGAARPQFENAATAANEVGLEALRIDALHMIALVESPERQLAANELALSVARDASDPVARNWDASLLNNIGMTHANAGDFEAAIVSFRLALAARERIGEPRNIRVGKWMVAWALRNLGRRGEALAIQLALQAELAAQGSSDPHVDAELVILEPS